MKHYAIELHVSTAALCSFLLVVINEDQQFHVLLCTWYTDIHVIHSVPAMCCNRDNMYSVNYAYHINYFKANLGEAWQNVINCQLPVSYSVIEPFLLCYNCSHRCIDLKLLRVISLYLSLYLFFLFTQYNQLCIV